MNESGILYKLIKHVAKLPGLGQRSARRIVLQLLADRSSLRTLSDLLRTANDEVMHCEICGNLDVVSPCTVCTNLQRNKRVVCVVESVSDLWAVERSRIFTGQYHVLGGLLSALNDSTPEKLRIPQLLARIKEDNVSEVIVAISATLDGQTTVHYIGNVLSDIDGVSVSRLAFGIPIGAELEYMDEGTIGVAMKLRSRI